MSFHPRGRRREIGRPRARRDKGVRLAILEQGARVLQRRTPLRAFGVYVVGFHCAKADPDHQMEAHHFCQVVNDDLIQCVVFDGNTAAARLVGVEYIVSRRLHAAMPEAERRYWHPHNFELLSGQLVAPGLPGPVEKEFFKLLMNSYGKTWHTWPAGGRPGDAGLDLPHGEPELMWSFNRDGECDPALRQARDEAMAVSTGAKRAQRRSLAALALPQQGVDELKSRFLRAAPVPGVVDAGADDSR